MTAARHRIVRVAETGSTNKDAMRLALAGEPLPLWVVAERQTDGRGRQGRAWTSLEGNLHASVAFATPAPPQAAGQLALLAGLALYDAVAAVTLLAAQARLRLKWPNDLLVDGAKAAGILIESTLSQSGGLVAVAGFGVNIAHAPGIDRPVAALGQYCATLNTEILLAALADSFETWLVGWDDSRGFGSIRANWLDRAGPVGQPITIHAGGTHVSGTYEGLGTTGALLARVGGRLEEFNFGDVALGAEPSVPQTGS